MTWEENYKQIEDTRGDIGWAVISALRTQGQPGYTEKPGLKKPPPKEKRYASGH